MSNSDQSEPESILIARLWKHSEAVNALPYLRSVVRSLREHWLASQLAQLQVQRLDARAGRPDRQALLLQADAAREAELAEERFDEARSELEAIDVYSLDPVRGVALIPFRQGEDLAWFVFDLFDPRGLVGWRLPADSLETRRPFVEQRDSALVDAIFSSRSFDQSPSRAGRR